MNKITIRFFDSLNFFLTAERRDREFSYSFKGNPSVKHLVEALRIPHTEIGEIIVCGKLKDLSYLVQDGDVVEVYPARSPMTIEERISQMGSGGDPPRFLLDNHLGKLATYLRLLGFDVMYRNDYQDEDLIEELKKETRILLTRDRGILMRRAIRYGYCIKSLDPRQQVVEVLKRYNLLDEVDPFKRCLQCNSPLLPIEKEVIRHRLEPLTRIYYNEFRICNFCDQIYWKGSHYQRMLNFLENIKEHD